MPGSYPDVRDVLLGASLLISLASLALHWYRGRKVVVLDWHEHKIASQPIGPAKYPPRFRRWLSVPLSVNNETRHNVRVVNCEWKIPRMFKDDLDLNATETDPRVRTVKPGAFEVVEITKSVQWEDLSAALDKTAPNSESRNSNSANRASVLIDLRVTLESDAFWRRRRYMQKTIEINGSTIRMAVKDQ